MSKSFAWAVPRDVIECAIKSNLNLDSAVSVWGAGFDEIGCTVFVVFEVDDSDIDKLFSHDMDCHELEEDELIQ